MDVSITLNKEIVNYIYLLSPNNIAVNIGCIVSKYYSNKEKNTRVSVASLTKKAFVIH